MTTLTTAAPLLHVTIDRARLLSALQLCNSVVETRNTIPVLGYFRITVKGGIAEIVATDLDLTAKATLDADTEALGGFLVEARLFIEAVRSAPGTHVALSVSDGHVRVESGTASVTLPILDIDDYPTVPELGGRSVVEFEVSSDMLRSLLRSGYAVGDDSRFQLDGVLLHVEKRQIETCGTDGHRMAQITLDDDAGVETDVLLPTKLVRTLGKLPADELVRILVGQDHIGLRGDGAELIARRVGVSFPNYRQYGGLQLANVAHADRESLIAALKRTIFFSQERTRLLKVTIRDKRLRLDAYGVEKEMRAADVVPLDYEGPELVIGLNGAYLLQALEAMTDDVVTFRFGTDTEPFYIQSAPATQPKELHLVMPMRLPW